MDANDFICKRCKSTFLNKNNLKTHLQKKKPCVSINISSDIDNTILLDELCNRKLNDKTFDCEYCHMKFNHASTKSRHKKICKSKPLDKITVLEKTVENLVSQIEDLKKHPTNITNNNTQNNTQNITNINVKLKDFGRENMDAVPNSLMSYLFMELRFRDLLSQLHCDPNFPENQNIRIRSVKRNTMEIFRNNKWDIVSFSKGLQELLLQGHRIFKDFYKSDKERILEEDMDEADLREILSQLQKIEDLNKNEIKPLIEDLQMMLEEFKLTGSAIVTI
jgi:hypothetical protein